MVLTTQIPELPVLEALFAYKQRPRHKDAWLALENREVRNIALHCAQRAREVARGIDDERLSRGGRDLNNYRRFYVAGVGIGLILSSRRSDHPYEWSAFVAYNTKPSKRAEKCCAEMRIVAGAKEARWCCIGGLLVLGENQPDGRSGILRNTLDPCGECRDMIRHERNKYLFSRHTRIVTSKPLSQFQKVESLPKMMAAHGETW